MVQVYKHFEVSVITEAVNFGVSSSIAVITTPPFLGLQVTGDSVMIASSRFVTVFCDTDSRSSEGVSSESSPPPV